MKDRLHPSVLPPCFRPKIRSGRCLMISNLTLIRSSVFTQYLVVFLWKDSGGTQTASPPSLLFFTLLALAYRSLRRTRNVSRRPSTSSHLDSYSDISSLFGLTPDSLSTPSNLAARFWKASRFWDMKSPRDRISSPSPLMLDSMSWTRYRLIFWALGSLASVGSSPCTRSILIQMFSTLDDANRVSRLTSDSKSRTNASRLAKSFRKFPWAIISWIFDLNAA
mmetsp:Transcript_10/g.27  ORF Transcript_10/g.27 Transcript_10/m.27 type:complete len:222 (-) Transcript_10:190-855(-)